MTDSSKLIQKLIELEIAQNESVDKFKTITEQFEQQLKDRTILDLS